MIKTVFLILFVSIIWNGKCGNITCNQPNQCENTVLTCITGEDCYVTCSAEMACRLATINCNNDGYDCYIRCSELYACDYSSITGPTNGNLLLECPGDASCSLSDIFCPFNGICDIRCNSEWPITFLYGHCDHFTVHANYMISGMLYIEAKGQSTHPAMFDSVIYCPHNNLNCIIECQELNACNGVQFFTASDSGLLQITASGGNVLADAQIYCLSFCNILVNGNGPNLLTNTKIYAVESFKDIIIKCDYDNSINDCYNVTQPPQIFCKQDYSESCNVILTSGIYNWECSNGDIDICNYYIITSSPTNNPTINPTTLPSNNPSRTPTNNPSIVPSNNPSMAPSDIPTKDPTSSPIECGDNNNSGPHGDIQCVSDQDCCSGFSCHKKGKCGRDRSAILLGNNLNNNNNNNLINPVFLCGLIIIIAFGSLIIGLFIPSIVNKLVSKKTKIQI